MASFCFLRFQLEHHLLQHLPVAPVHLHVRGLLHVDVDHPDAHPAQPGQVREEQQPRDVGQPPHLLPRVARRLLQRGRPTLDPRPLRRRPGQLGGLLQPRLPPQERRPHGRHATPGQRSRRPTRLRLSRKKSDGASGRLLAGA